MKGPSVWLKARKRFVCAAAIAAVLVILASGANALANNVRCVPNLSVSPSCTVAFSHIQDAVNTAVDLDVVMVAPGYYNETVSISGFNSLTILGAQAGKDARVGRHNPAKESIVDASGTPYGSGGGAAFFVIDSIGVVIDGFTIQGGGSTTPLGADASGIFATTDLTSIQILNNIIQNNALGVGIEFATSGLIEYNLFKSNNMGKAGSSLSPFGSMWGFGIAGYHIADLAIAENEFTGNLAAAIDLIHVDPWEITKNTSAGDGSFAVLDNCPGGFFSQNQGRDFGPPGSLPIALTSPSSPADAAVDVGPTSDFLQINGNDLEEGKTPYYNGIAFSTIFGAGPNCISCQVSNNTIKGFAGNGIVLEELSGTGTMNYSVISGNDVEDNGNDGIFIEEASSNDYNLLVDNKAEGNHTYDCEDDTSLLSGPGTASTWNTWSNDIGSLSDPAGLCPPDPRPRHEY